MSGTCKASSPGPAYGQAKGVSIRAAALRALRPSSRGRRWAPVRRADPGPAGSGGLPASQGQGRSWAANQALLASELLLLLEVSSGSPLGALLEQDISPTCRAGLRTARTQRPHPDTKRQWTPVPGHLQRPGAAAPRLLALPFPRAVLGSGTRGT